MGKTRTGDGYRFECLTRDELIAHGYQVIRAAASKGPADIVAIRPNELLFIQCKFTTHLPVSSLSVCPPSERKAVLRLAHMVQGSALLAHPVKDGNRAVQVAFKRITGPESYNFVPWVLSRASV